MNGQSLFQTHLIAYTMSVVATTMRSAGLCCWKRKVSQNQWAYFILVPLSRSWKKWKIRNVPEDDSNNAVFQRLPRGIHNVYFFSIPSGSWVNGWRQRRQRISLPSHHSIRKRISSHWTIVLKFVKTRKPNSKHGRIFSLPVWFWTIRATIGYGLFRFRNIPDSPVLRSNVSIWMENT